MTRAATVIFTSLFLIMSACTLGGGGSTGSEDPGQSSDIAASEETTSTTEACTPSTDPLLLDAAPQGSSAELIDLSGAIFDCQPVAVVLGRSDVASARFAAETAVDLGAPLLAIDDPADTALVAAELQRLQVEQIVTIGVAAPVRAELGPQEVQTLEVPSTTTTPTTSPSSTTSTSDTTDPDGEETPSTTTTTAPTTAPEDDGEPPAETTTTTQPTPTLPSFEAVATDIAPSADGPVVIFKPGSEAAAYRTLPAVVLGGGEVIVADPSDTDGIRTLLDGRTNAFLSGELTPTEQWQINLAASDSELFGGGTKVFPDRRIIAYYGNPLTFRLGILGETDPDRAVERVSERAELYNAEGLPPALPGFEIIVTVAATQAGDDGDYSNEMDIEVVRPWIDAAMANEVSVILDLQPGRTDFVTQAKLYEEFLRLPNVGLALDPEWRLEPDQRHLRQIGSVGAEEINAVVDYLTGLVHEENLPQKVLILHQFNTRMLPERELVKTPPEIAMVIHVDGQGSLGSKYGTWNAMLEAPTDPDQELWWAWKNFIDEDFPTATPRQVNAVEPLPYIVTYQ